MSDDYYDGLCRPVQPDPPIWLAVLLCLLVGGGMAAAMITGLALICGAP